MLRPAFSPRVISTVVLRVYFAIQIMPVTGSGPGSMRHFNMPSWCSIATRIGASPVCAERIAASSSSIRGATARVPWTTICGV
jgi:hypothetical protein